MIGSKDRGRLVSLLPVQLRRFNEPRARGCSKVSLAADPILSDR